MLEIEVGDTVRIAATSEYYNRTLENEYDPRCDGVCTDALGGMLHTHVVKWESGKSNNYKACDLTLVKKGKAMQFTKSDLKTGMFVKQRGGEFKIVLDDVISGGNSWSDLSNYDDGILKKSRGFAALDIVAVYERIKGGCLSDYLEGQRLKIIWERTEQTEAQKEMEILQEQAKALQEQIAKLQGKL